MQYLQFLLCLLPLAAAVDFTNPSAGDTLSRGSTVNVNWTSVDTDPTSFDIYLWNFVYYPPFYHYIKTVPTSDLSTTITIPCDVTAEDGWQFTAIQNMNVYVITAQTGKFTIDNTACNSPTVGPNPESCPSTKTIDSNGGAAGASASVGVGNGDGSLSLSVIPGVTATVTVTVPAASDIPGLPTCSQHTTTVSVPASTCHKGTVTRLSTISVPASTCTRGAITRVSTTTVYKKTTTATTTVYRNKHAKHTGHHNHGHGPAQYHG